MNIKNISLSIVILIILAGIAWLISASLGGEGEVVDTPTSTVGNTNVKTSTSTENIATSTDNSATSTQNEDLENQLEGINTDNLEDEFNQIDRELQNL